MTANVSSFYQNLSPDKKPSDTVEKDIRKWVESVVEFKANLDKLKNESPTDKHLKKIKKFKIKKKPSVLAVQINAGRKTVSGQRKSLKSKKVSKKTGAENADKLGKKPSSPDEEAFKEIKESFRSVKLPQNWTSGLSSGRIVFNRVKLTTYNSQQKMSVERSLVITKDRNVHILINGSEIALNNWEMQKVGTVDDIKKAIKDIDSLKIFDVQSNGPKSPNGKMKTDLGSKSESANLHKVTGKKIRPAKKSGSGNKVSKQQSFQK